MAHHQFYPGWEVNYYGSYFGSDILIEKLGIGIGLHFLRDYYSIKEESPGNILRRKNEAGLTASKHFKVNDWKISTGIQGTYSFYKENNWPGRFYPSPTRPVVIENQFFDFNGGVSLENKNFKSGFSVHHFTSPDQHIIKGSNILRPRFSSYAGYEFFKGDDDKFSFNPIVLYQQQADFHQLLPYLNFKYDFLKLGIANNIGDYFIFNLGYDRYWLNITYSYDVVFSNLSNQNLGSHELSFSLIPGEINNNSQMK